MFKNEPRSEERKGRLNTPTRQSDEMEELESLSDDDSISEPTYQSGKSSSSIGWKSALMEIREEQITKLT